MKKKLVLGLSGGVDSAVALSMLQEEFEVHSVFLNMGLVGEEDARRLAATMGSPFHVLDISEQLEQEVCRPFAACYLAGKTPSPCAHCNPTVKFPALFSLADEIGARYVATGHYARIIAQNGAHFLAKSRSPKDQSYMLARLPHEMIPRLKFPLGDLDKAAVRQLAADRQLFVANKPDSMEICFVPNDDYALWMEQNGYSSPEGNFVDKEGNVLGRHKGIHHYTIGQGKGLGVSYRHRLFVSHIDVENNEIVLSDGSDLFKREILTEDINLYCKIPPTVSVKFRHGKIEHSATLEWQEQRLLIHTEELVRAPAAGQLAVFYDGEIVVGSGWIADMSQ